MMFGRNKNPDEQLNKYWKRYERGIDYLNRKNIITQSDKCWNFFAGNQWEGLKVSQKTLEELPTLNLIKKIIKHKVATISQNNMIARYSDSQGRTDMADFYKHCDALFAEAWELCNEDMELWSVLKDAAVTGDGIQYFPDADFTNVQRLTNTSILYGDESQSKIQKQPYIIIHERRLVEDVRNEAKDNGLSDEEISRIVSDSEREYMIGNKSEIDEDGKSGVSKVTCITHFELKSDGLHVAKATKNVVFDPDHLVKAENGVGDSRALKMYPFIKISWEDFPNSARGLSDVAQLIPNQIEINKTYARLSMIIKTCAYPRMAYDSQLIQNPEALDEVGSAIEVNAGGVESITQAVNYLSPAQISSEPSIYADRLMDNTLEISGAGETATGNIDPTRVAASAIATIKDQAALPLKEQVAKVQTYVEDFARLILQLKSVYEPNGFTVQSEETDPITGITEIKTYTITKEELDDMSPKIRVDTSQDTIWTKEAEQQRIKELFDANIITFEEFVDALPDHSDYPKEKLKQIIAARKLQQSMQPQIQTEEEIAQSAMAQWEAEDNGLEMQQ